MRDEQVGSCSSNSSDGGEHGMVFSRRNYLFGLALLTLAAGRFACADDELCADVPNPFTPAPLVKETTGANWRHGVHLMRQTFTDYFKVYDEELDGFEATTLEKLRADLGFYIDRKVQF